jgi:hypothetical protein
MQVVEIIGGIYLREISPNLIHELENHKGNKNIAEAHPYLISDYQELVRFIARLAYANKDYLLFFRGQPEDYLNKANSSTIYPSIYRSEYLRSDEINNRFTILQSACEQLIELFKQKKLDGYDELRKKTYIQYSILQHYAVCRTPLLDLTHSIRVACSFAQLSTINEFSYVFVFGLPYLTNRISINSEHDLVNIRLLSIAPPDALRPYFQDGYLAGTTDITTDYFSDKSQLDFRNRLIAKFRIPNNNGFWGEHFSKISEKALLPSDDKVTKLCKSISLKLDFEYQPEELGKFILAWNELEKDFVTSAETISEGVRTVTSASAVLNKEIGIPEHLIGEINQLKTYRDEVFHGSKRASSSELHNKTVRVQNAHNLLKNFIK